jgi:hypothetical protein
MRLFETLELYKFEAIIKVDTRVNITDVLNLIRAVPYVIIVRTIEDPRLEYKKTENHIYVLISIKFFNTAKSAAEGINKIKKDIMIGGQEAPKIEGVLKFVPIMKTLRPAKQ